jgi:hypothetical protein
VPLQQWPTGAIEAPLKCYSSLPIGNQHRRSRNRRFSAASVFLRPQHSAAEPQPEADSSLRCASLGMTCYSECYMSLRPTHRDELDSSVILSAATIGFSSRLATSLPISATEHGVSSVSSLFRLCRSQSTRTRFGRGGSLAPCGRRPPQARGFPRSQVHTPFS